MRILYLVDRLSLRGGADQHLLQVVNAAVEGGAEVTVAFGRREANLSLPAGVSGVRMPGLASAVATASRLGRLRELGAEHDVLHVQNVMNPVALTMATATGRALVTVQDHRVFCPGIGKTRPNREACQDAMSTTTCASCLPSREYRERTLELTAARRDAIAEARLLVLSRYMAKELAAAGLPEAEVLPPWVEADPGDHNRGSGFVLGGRLVPHKGVLDAWKAWQDAATNQPLAVAGVGPLAARLEGSERLGWLAARALRSLLAQARALLFPSFWQEPFGLLGVEALAMGTPVIVADSGGTEEWSGAGCIRVLPGDIPAMAAAIRDLATDPERAHSLGREGQAAVRKHFARQPIASRLLKIYAEVAGEGKTEAAQ